MGEVGRRRGRASARRRRTWPERGAEHGATGKAGTDDPPPTERREVANERSEEREERRRAVVPQRCAGPGAGGGRPAKGGERLERVTGRGGVKSTEAVAADACRLASLAGDLRSGSPRGYREVVCHGAGPIGPEHLTYTGAYCCAWLHASTSGSTRAPCPCSMT